MAFDLRYYLECIIINMVIDWSEIYKKYKGQWVGLMPDEKTVVSSGKTAKEAWEKAIKKIKKPILTRVPSKLISYVGSHA